MNSEFPSIAEVCCAKAHIEAYKLQLQYEAEWALVLEDDAIVMNMQGIKLLKEKLNARIGHKPEIVSLFYHDTITYSSNNTLGVYKVFGYPVSAVAYFINISAAKILIEQNSRLVFKADWPRAGSISFLASQEILIGHPTDTENSFIEKSRKRKRYFKSIPKKMCDVLFLTLFLNRNAFNSPSDYFIKLLQPTLSFWIGRVISRAKNDQWNNRKLFFARNN